MRSMLGIGGGPLPVLPLPLLPLFGAGIRNVAACDYCIVWLRPAGTATLSAYSAPPHQNDV